MRARRARWIAAILLAGCDVGGGGGGGPAAVPLPQRPAFQRPPDIADSAARGKIHYRNLGCALCHGEAGAGGVGNRNSETGGLINGLTKVREGYSREELAKLIGQGVAKVGKKDPRGPTPPLRMPGFAAYLTEPQMGDLVAHLFSLHPRKSAEAKAPAPGAESVKPAASSEEDWDKEDKEEKGAAKPAPQPAKRKPAPPSAAPPSADDWDKEEEP